MVASEATPFVKTGGLADVVGSLPPELKALGLEVAVVLPWYREAKAGRSRCVIEHAPVWLGPRACLVRLHVSEARGVPFYLVECPELYDRNGLYAGPDGEFPDNHVRFAVLARAALIVARRLFRPHIFHCHDWQAALVPLLLRTAFAQDPTFLGARTLLTIHNLGYQGVFASWQLGQTGLNGDLFHPGCLEFYGDVNLLKGGIVSSDAISTVSKGYAREIQTPDYGFRLDGLLRGRSGVLHGILNGVDYSVWNPETDPRIPFNYSAADLSGKRACKAELLRSAGLPASALERPLVGIVSRFASQKGFDLLEQAAGDLVSADLSLVALGAGEARYEALFRDLAARYPDRFAVRIAYDEDMAHWIEAGSDIFLMPSRYEPCGLNQIYSLRYGTVPVVRATGGLDDTIDSSTGFKFEGYSAAAMAGALRDALGAFRNPERWRRLMLNGMAKDYSWGASAGEYAGLYRRLASESRGEPASST